MENKVQQQGSSTFLESNNGKAVVLLAVTFLITAWYRLFLSLPLLVLLFFVKRKSKIAIVIAGLYSIFLTVVNVSVYAAGGYNEQGVFDASVAPIYIYVGLLIATLVYLVRSFKQEV